MNSIVEYSPGAEDGKSDKEIRKANEYTNDGPVIPIIPTHREGQCRIDEPFCKFDMTTWKG